MSPKISDYATQHAEAGYEEKVKNRKKTFLKILENVISLIFRKFWEILVLKKENDCLKNS